MIKRYLRHEDGRPFGVVVVDESNHIGWSLCSPLDHFNKKRGEQIAINRLGRDWIAEIEARRPVHKECYKVNVKRNGSSVIYNSRVDAVLDKATYLYDKVKGDA